MSRVLIVDDEPDIVYMMQVILRSEGYDVESTPGVGAAIAALVPDRKPDLVLLDLSLSDGDGWQVMEKIRDDPALRHIPVVILSAHSAALAEDRARAAGATRYMTKPFAAGELLDAVREIIG